jgi:hypothetical protein
MATEEKLFKLYNRRKYKGRRVLFVGGSDITRFPNW